MKSFIILAICMSVLVPVRVAVTNCFQAEKNADEIVQNVSGTVSGKISETKRRLKLKTRATTGTLANGVSQCVRTGVSQVKSVAEEAVGVALNIDQGSSTGPRGSRYLKSARAYIDLALLAAIFTLLRRTEKRTA